MPNIAFVIRSLLRIAGWLPLPAARFIGGCLGRISLLLNTRMVQITRKNIGLCFPDMPKQEQDALTTQSVLQTARLAIEVAPVWASSPQWLKNKILKVHNQHLVTDAIDQKQGVLILAPHIGNWEVLGLYLGSIAPVTNLYQRPKQDSLDPIIQSARERHGATLVATDMKGLGKVLAALKRGEISGILPDQTPRDNNSGLFTPFFGQPAFTMTLAHKLLQKSHATPIFAYAKRVRGGFEIIFDKAPEAITDKDQTIAIEALSQGIEQCVKAIPDQYQWEYKRFKKQPEGVADPYHS